MRKTHKNRAVNPQHKGRYLKRIVVLTNRIVRYQRRCLKKVEVVMKNVRNVEGDVEIVAREVARQAEQAKSDGLTQ